MRSCSCIFAVFGMTLALVTVSPAQTNIFNTNDVWMTNAANWSQGVLPTTVVGYVEAPADGWLDTASGWIVVQNGGLVGIAGQGVLTEVTAGSLWTLNGGTLGDVNLRISGSTLLTVNSNGTVKTAGGRDFTVLNDSLVVINDGTFEIGRHWWMRNTAIASGSGTITAGNIQITESALLALTNCTINVSGSFGQRATNPNGGSIRLDSCTLTADTYRVQTTGHRLTFAGSGAGSATFRDWQSITPNVDDEILIDFLSGARMSMAMTNARPLVIPDGVTNTGIGWAEVLWNNDQLLFDGQAKSDLAMMTWTDATSRGAFENDQRFDFDGSTLSLIVESTAGVFFIIR